MRETEDKDNEQGRPMKKGTRGNGKVRSEDKVKDTGRVKVMI